MDAGERKKLSKKLAVILRHRPEEFDVTLDPAGWASVAQVVRALHRRGGAFFSRVDVSHVTEVIAHQDKPRYELSSDDLRIRAAYGHSVEVTDTAPASEPPEVLFHGTTASAAERIRAVGLRLMGRAFVHLSADRETAAVVGRRRVRRDDRW